MSTQATTVRGRTRTDSLTARLAMRVVLAAAARVRVGCLSIVLPDGARLAFGDAASDEQAEIRIHDHEAFVRLLLGGEIGAGEAYMDDLWSSPDLAGLLRLAALNRQALALSSGWFRLPGQLMKTLAHRLNRNTQPQSRRNMARTTGS